MRLKARYTHIHSWVLSSCNILSLNLHCRSLALRALHMSSTLLYRLFWFCTPSSHKCLPKATGRLTQQQHTLSDMLQLTRCMPTRVWTVASCERFVFCKATSAADSCWQFRYSACVIANFVSSELQSVANTCRCCSARGLVVEARQVIVGLWLWCTLSWESVLHLLASFFVCVGATLFL